MADQLTAAKVLEENFGGAGPPGHGQPTCCRRRSQKKILVALGASKHAFISNFRAVSKEVSEAVLFGSRQHVTPRKKTFLMESRVRGTIVIVLRFGAAFAFFALACLAFSSRAFFLVLFFLGARVAYQLLS